MADSFGKHVCAFFYVALVRFSYSPKMYFQLDVFILAFSYRKGKDMGVEIN